MLYVDYEDDTKDAAVKKALRDLNLSLEEINYEVLSEGKRGLFGIGKKELARIRVYYKEEDEIKKVLTRVKKIISKLDESSTVTVEKKDGTRYDVNVESENSAHLIGKRGRGLAAIQDIVNCILQKYENNYKIIVDIGNYNSKRDSQLIKWAIAQAKIVLSNKRSLVMKSLNAYERRLIHLELQKYSELTTESKGEGKVKNIKIRYVGSHVTS